MRRIDHPFLHTDLDIAGARWSHFRYVKHPFSQKKTLGSLATTVLILVLTYAYLLAAMFDFMGLPAELRIRIYEYALVREIIRIVSDVHPFGAVHPCGLEKVRYCYLGTNPEMIVTLRRRRIRLNNVNSAGEEVGNEISSSYGIQPNRSPPVVNLFLTSRKVYSETWPIFYQQNAFAFTMPRLTWNSTLECLRFLYDRPYHALRHIRELHLRIGNAPGIPIRYELASGPWQCLLDEISRYMSVRILVLYIRGRTDDARKEHSPDLPWREWLCEITGLQELHMDIISENTDEQSIAFVQQMRSKMVVGGEQMGTEGFVLGKRSIPSLKWTVREPANSLLTSSEYPDMDEIVCF